MPYTVGTLLNSGAIVFPSLLAQQTSDSHCIVGRWINDNIFSVPSQFLAKNDRADYVSTNRYGCDLFKLFWVGFSSRSEWVMGDG